jgi:hypothetical protein
MAEQGSTTVERLRQSAKADAGFVDCDTDAGTAGEAEPDRARTASNGLLSQRGDQNQDCAEREVIERNGHRNRKHLLPNI